MVDLHEGYVAETLEQPVLWYKARASIVMPRERRLQLNIVNKYRVSNVVYDLACLNSINASTLEISYGEQQVTFEVGLSHIGDFRY